MKKNQNAIIQLFIFIMFLLVGTCVFAKRMPPPVVQPVIYQNIIYSAAYDQGGQIEARSQVTKKLLWSKQIYHIQYKDGLEKDIQEVYIKDLMLKKNNLLIVDEKERQYLLNLKTREVKGLDGKSKHHLKKC